ncbi:MAG TPA: flagellar biosynthesis protein FlhB [Mobilitalea sp.]|nr:flagellar biosynthesis protein FlhB [Mobilitalea sp.]
MIQIDQIRYASYRLSYNLQYFAEGADKTEEPTAKKLQDARHEGQVARSTELITASGLATLFIILKLFSGSMAKQFIEIYRNSFTNIDVLSGTEFSIALAGSILSNAIITIIRICLPIFAVAMIVSFVVVLYQVKWEITMKTIMPKFSKINPVNGFKKILSKDKIVELFIEILKIGVIAYVAYSTLKNEWKTLLILYDMKLEQAMLLIGNLVINLGLKISMIFLVIGLGDLIYQKLKFRKDMRMTKQEIKDEFKNSEGDPQVKGKIKQRMREASMRRMMQNLPKADVVITNPTHLAAAIKYDKDTSEAPVLIAKGADYLAQKIKDVAKENHIEIIENKPLARMLYYNVEVGAEIPPELYQMTAEVLAYVYGLKK